MNLPQKLCPQDHSTGLYNVIKMTDTVWVRSKSAAAGRQKFMHSFPIASEFALLCVRKKDVDVSLAASFFLSKSDLFAFLCGVSLPATWKTF